MGHLSKQLEKAAYVRAAKQLVAPVARKTSFMQRLKPAVANAAIRTNQKLLNYNAMGLDPTIAATVAAPVAGARIASKLGAKAMGWLKSKIKPQSKSIDLSNSDASWLNNTGLREELSAAPKFKLPKLPTVN